MPYVLALMMWRYGHFCQFIGLFLLVMFQRTTPYNLSIVCDGKKNLTVLFHYLINVREGFDIRGFYLEVGLYPRSVKTNEIVLVLGLIGFDVYFCG